MESTQRRRLAFANLNKPLLTPPETGGRYSYKLKIKTLQEVEVEFFSYF